MKEEKLKRFANDDTMRSAVYDLLMKSFTAKKPVIDVNVLAAQRIAIDLLNDAWRELNSHKGTEQRDTTGTQLGM